MTPRYLLKWFIIIISLDLTESKGWLICMFNCARLVPNFCWKLVYFEVWEHVMVVCVCVCVCVCEQEGYLASAQQYAQITELSKRVNDWENKILPKLQEEVCTPHCHLGANISVMSGARNTSLRTAQSSVNVSFSRLHCEHCSIMLLEAVIIMCTKLLFNYALHW